MALRTTRRNLAARSPLMGKGGAHLPARGARARERRALDEGLDEWWEEAVDGPAEHRVSVFPVARDQEDERGDA